MRGYVPEVASLKCQSNEYIEVFNRQYDGKNDSSYRFDDLWYNMSPSLDTAR